jgi:hypothetical protein
VAPLLRKASTHVVAEGKFWEKSFPRIMNAASRKKPEARNRAVRMNVRLEECPEGCQRYPNIGGKTITTIAAHPA